MSSSSPPCAACKLLRRKCSHGCVFAPYFPPDQPARFANVHKVFGASNVSKLLNNLPESQREDTVNSLVYEAEARLRDPVYGCVATISILQRRIKQVRDEIIKTRNEIAAYIGPEAFLEEVPTQYAAGMGLGVGMMQPQPHQHQHQQMALQQHQQMALQQHQQMALQQHQQLALQQHQQMALQQHPYHEVHQQQMQIIADAQHMAATVKAAREEEQERMMMRQGYAVPGVAGAPTVAAVPRGSPEAATYEGASYLIQQQPPPSALHYRLEPSPPPQSSGTHVDMPPHAQQGQHHMYGSDDGSWSASPPA